MRPECWLALCTALLLGLVPAGVHAQGAGTFTDRNNACTMKLTEQEEGKFLVGIICERRKVLSYWLCPPVDNLGFTPFECREQVTQTVDPTQGTKRESKGRHLRIYAPSMDRVPYVLCGRLCDPTTD